MYFTANKIETLNVPITLSVPKGLIKLKGNYTNKITTTSLPFFPNSTDGTVYSRKKNHVSYTYM